MASGRDKVLLKSTAGTGHFYTTTKNKRSTKPNAKQKLKLRKYDPKARKHVIYEEGKIK